VFWHGGSLGEKHGLRIFNPGEEVTGEHLTWPVGEEAPVAKSAREGFNTIFEGAKP
jgi:hypothetical protein